MLIEVCTVNCVKLKRVGSTRYWQAILNLSVELVVLQIDAT